MCGAACGAGQHDGGQATTQGQAEQDKGRGHDAELPVVDDDLLLGVWDVRG